MPASEYPIRIHSVLGNFADECCGTLARLFAYMGALALVAIVGIHVWDILTVPVADEFSPTSGWSQATRSRPAFAISQSDSNLKTETYDIFRHPLGGRKDVLRWAASGEPPAVELEIYRPGGEWKRSEPAIAEIADRMDPGGGRELETAGVIDSKFGTVTLLQLKGAKDVPACLGFLKQMDDPDLRISGWSCQGDTLPARRASIGCLLNRLTLLSAGNEPRLGELFARAELKRGNCAAPATAAASTNWVSSAENPKLRGRL